MFRISHVIGTHRELDRQSLDDIQALFEAAFPDLASEHKVSFMPFILEGIALKKELNQADGIHPNATGARIMTENIYKALRPMLAKAST